VAATPYALLAMTPSPTAQTSLPLLQPRRADEWLTFLLVLQFFFLFDARSNKSRLALGMVQVRPEDGRGARVAPPRTAHAHTRGVAADEIAAGTCAARWVGAADQTEGAISRSTQTTRLGTRLRDAAVQSGRRSPPSDPPPPRPPTTHPPDDRRRRPAIAPRRPRPRPPPRQLPLAPPGRSESLSVPGQLRAWPLLYLVETIDLPMTSFIISFAPP